MNELIQTEPSRDEMVVYLWKHFRYFTMNSWNRSKSYARNVKIYNLGLTEDQSIRTCFCRGNMIRWKYNRFGHVEIWNEDKPTDRPGKADIYLQVDTDVKAFFEVIGLNQDEVNVNDWDTCNDPGYF